MKKILMALLIFSFSFAANGAISFSYGHWKWADDGMPEIAAGEQVSVFYCVSSTSYYEAKSCSMRKCLDKFKKENLCKLQGGTTEPSYHVVMIGKKGDNSLLYDGGASSKSRDEAIKPINKAMKKDGIYFFDGYEAHGIVMPNTKHQRNFNPLNSK